MFFFEFRACIVEIRSISENSTLDSKYTIKSENKFVIWSKTNIPRLNKLKYVLFFLVLKSRRINLKKILNEIIWKELFKFQKEKTEYLATKKGMNHVYYFCNKYVV